MLPLKLRAELILPGTHVAADIVPLYPLPEVSCARVPEPSSKFQYPISPCVSVRVVAFEVPLKVAIKVMLPLVDPLLVTENCAAVDPVATVTDCGTMTAVLLLLSATVVAVVTALVNETVQALEEAPESDVGLQATALSVAAAGDTLRVAVCGDAPDVAVKVTEAPVDPLLTAKNWALVEPLDTVTDCGNVTAGLLLLSVTVAVNVAGPVNVTVHALEEAPESDVGVQATALSVGTAGDIVSVVLCELPLVRLAVTVTEVLVAPLLLTENGALFEPLEIVTDGGTVTAELLLFSATTIADVAGPDNVTVQAPEEAPESEVGVQVTALSVSTAGDTVSVVLCELPLVRLAVTVTEALVAPLLLTENGALLEPLEIVTDGGTVTAELLLFSATTIADVAGPDNVTVQAPEEAPESEVGVQVTALSVSTAGDTVSVVLCELPLVRLAVTVTEALVAPLLLTENWALFEPLEIVTDGGTFTAELLLLSATTMAELVALLNVAVQTLDVEPEIGVGLQTSDVSAGVDVRLEGTVSVPPLPDSAIAPPAPDAAVVFTTLIAEV